MSRIAMSGNQDSGSIIGVFRTKEEAKEWLERMVVMMVRDQGTKVKETELVEVNARWRAGVVFEKEQMEFDFDN